MGRSPRVQGVAPNRCRLVTEAGTVERLFLAVELEPAVRRALRDHLNGVVLPGRAVPPGSWHLTLRFLGDTDAPRRRALEEALAAADRGPAFTASLGGLGAFPRAARATVLWMAVRDGGGLARLAAVAERAARSAGFAAEERPFRAHLTLARLRPPADVAPLLQRVPPAGIDLPVRYLTLFRSRPGSGAPTYDALAAWPLG